jgi:hypothetical protein
MKPAEQLLYNFNLDKTGWGRRIILAEKLGRFSAEEIDMSHNWVTCACGEQCRLLPTHDDSNEPADAAISELGTYFWYCVSDNEFVDAAETLINIENRVGELLACS